ncbi:outer membrane scaffolding protein for murein synthesis (MipA/OmpV family) [Collimonas sp. PA-H2]|uniref:MipA/OmpV family protein n=1 Tax=Collimonas sp. PA-H2 TaxID=1881062 RepID=UPI000C00B2E2|nr:MipA/OmpV family protein [Collimonas sp. PA-H2]PFH08867.1 outer membrane scaffolding protein for murein synthesis (MipA/OmpV family) [Collimonas sp. PA-H2]
MKHQTKSILALALYGVLASRAALAQQAAPAPSKSWLQDSQVTIGLGAGGMARYAGSDEYHVVPVPILKIVTPSGFFVDTMEGAGYRYDINDMFFASAAIGYGAGRKDSDDGLQPGSAKLKGMGEIKGSVLANIEAGIKLGRIGTLSLAISEPVSNRERGLSYRVQISSTVLELAKDKVSVSAAAMFGDAKYNQTFFGVNAVQSRNSGYAQYTAESGLNAVNASLVWTHSFNRTWSLSTMLGATHYMQKAADSPLVQAKTNYSGFATVNYSF